MRKQFLVFGAGTVCGAALVFFGTSNASPKRPGGPVRVEAPLPKERAHSGNPKAAGATLHKEPASVEEVSLVAETLSKQDFLRILKDLDFTDSRYLPDKERAEANNMDSDRQRYMFVEDLLLQDFVKRLAPSEFAGVADELAKQDSSWRRAGALGELFKRWAAEDPTGLSAWILQAPDGNPRDPFDHKNMAIDGLVFYGRDPMEALSVAEKLPEALASRAYDRIFSSLSKTDSFKAQALLARVASPEHRRSAMYGIINGWSQKDPHAALAWVSQLPAEAVPPGAYSQPLRVLAMRDTPSAVNFITSMREGPERDRSISSVCIDLSCSGKYGTAMQLALMLAPGETQNEALRSIASFWGQNRPEEMQAWADQQTDGRVREALLPAVAAEIAATNPQAALQLASSLSNPDVLGDVAARWAANDPAAAAAYFQKLPKNARTNTAFSGLARAWSENDPEASARWLQVLPPDGRRDAAIKGYVSAVLPRDPAKAGQTALGISDPQLRNSILSEVAGRWMSCDPEEAARWIAQPSFPAELRHSLRNSR